MIFIEKKYFSLNAMNYWLQFWRVWATIAGSCTNSYNVERAHIWSEIVLLCCFNNEARFRLRQALELSRQLSLLFFALAPALWWRVERFFVESVLEISQFSTNQNGYFHLPPPLLDVHITNPMVIPLVEDGHSPRWMHFLIEIVWYFV